MIDEHVRQMVQEFAGRIQQQGLNIEQYMQMTGMTPDALMTQMRPEAEKRIKTRLTLEEIVKAENIEATEKDIEDEIQNIASMYGMEIDKLKEAMGDDERQQVAEDMAVQKAVEFIAENASEVETAEEKAEE